MSDFKSIILEITNGRIDALEFIVAWQAHCHRVDDLIDKKITDKDVILEAFVKAQELLMMPFFQANQSKLWPTLVLIANAYADANHFENSEDPNKLRISDVLRNSGNEMLLLIASICTTEDQNVWDRLRKFSPRLRLLAWRDHHDFNNKPI